MKTANEWLDRLEDLFVEELGEGEESSIAISKHPDGGMVANILIKAEFQNTDSSLSQINIMLVPDTSIQVEDEVHIDTDFTDEAIDGEALYFPTREGARDYARSTSGYKFQDYGPHCGSKRWAAVPR